MLNHLFYYFTKFGQLFSLLISSLSMILIQILNPVTNSIWLVTYIYLVYILNTSCFSLSLGFKTMKAYTFQIKHLMLDHAKKEEKKAIHCFKIETKTIR